MCISVYAADAQGTAVSNQSVIYYSDGSYLVITVSEQSSISTRATTSTKTGSKNHDFYDSDNELQWRVTTTGTFSYNGSSCTCTSSSVSSQIFSSKWKVTSAVASKSGNVATGTFVVKRYALLIPVQTVSTVVTLTCSAAGTLS